MKIFQNKTKISANLKLAEGYFKFVLEAKQIARSSLPGQFVMVDTGRQNKPLLRRPFSIHKVRGGKIEILYEVVGEGTKILSQKKPGEDLDLIGPLGNGFKYKPSGNKAILIAGGMGVAPLVFLAQELKSKRVLVLIGAKTKNRIICAKEFANLGCDLKIATDDGSAGFKGYVNDLLKNILAASGKPQAADIFGCGPKPMLRDLSQISREFNIPAQVSLEAHMACGFGACLGCAVETQAGLKRACKEGPVFKADEIIWQGEKESGSIRKNR